MALVTFTWVAADGTGTATGHHFLDEIGGEVFAFAVNAAGVTHIDSGLNVAKLAPSDVPSVAAGRAAIEGVRTAFGAPRMRSVLAGARKL